MKTILSIAAIIALPALASAPAPTKPEPVSHKATLTLDGAKRVIAVAVAEARKNNASGVVAVVDDGGNLMALERLDNTFAAGAEISIGKARTAALFKKPTKFFEEVIKNGRTAMTALPSSVFTPLQGGIPLMVDGQIVGGVGVSGASSAQQDEEFAIAGADSLSGNSAESPDSRKAASAIPATPEQPSAAVTEFESVDVSAAFAKGMPLIENGQFKVHASRREKPGQVEVHDDDTDIIYVLEGAATFITGGTMVDGKPIAPGETRGESTQGGETHLLMKGDVIVVPRGVPHWFKEVQGPLLYYTVKVTSPVPQEQHATALVR